MRRRISLLLAAVLASGTLVLLSSAPPASAWVVCGGQGTATVTPGLLYPVAVNVGTGANLVEVLIGGELSLLRGFSFGFNVGGCVHPPSTTISNANATGILLGYCSHSSGIGTLGGELFAFVNVGSTLLLTGHLVGVLTIAPTPGTGSCSHFGTPVSPTFGLPSGATDFLITGGSVAFNCSALGDTTILTQVFLFDTLVPPGIHLSMHWEIHFWFNQLCVPGSPVL